MYLKFYSITIFLCLAIPVKGRGTEQPDSLTIGEILIKGNYITSTKIINRELDFTLNEVIKREEVEYRKQTSINNLTKTSLFNFVEIETEVVQENSLRITVNLTERWFIWPNLYLNQTDRNFSEWWRTKDLAKLEYGVGVKINNFRGMGETLILNYHLGNFTKYELDYNGIYIDKAKRHSLSALASYSAISVLPWNIESNKEKVLKENRKLIKSTDFSIIYRYRKSYFNTHSVELGYSDSRIADTILALNPYYLGFKRHSLYYFNLKYEFSRDTRDSKIYPKTGYLVSASVNKRGLGILRDEYNAVDLSFQFYKYWKLKKRFYLASGIWYVSNLTDSYAFYSQTGLGYLQFVRGYEYYAINGNNAILFKCLAKYELLPRKVINLNVWPVRKLHQFNRIPIEIYVNLFFDSGYVSDNFEISRTYYNTLVNKMMFSTGAGIDFITYYDKVLRFDYSFNALGERGLFIHWKAAIR
jgi:outer membrane protein assembly factor BamA